MAVLQKDTQLSSRYGLNLRLCAANDLDKIYQRIEFANISSASLDADAVFATGGAIHKRKIAFFDGIVGELTLTTQILTQDLLCLMSASGASWDGHSPIVFRSRGGEREDAYAMIGETVWKDKNGCVYGEQLIFHRIRPRVAYKRTYSGDGDVADVKIVFDILLDESNRAMTRGIPKLLVVGGTLLTTQGYVTEDGVWVTGSIASYDDNTIILNG